MTTDIPWPPDYNEMLRSLLESYEPIANPAYMVLAPSGKYHRNLHENVDAAIRASTLHLSSIDYAKKRYGRNFENSSSVSDIENRYIEAYFLAKEYISSAKLRLSTDGRPLPTEGVFGASLVLERLSGSFFSAHLLYRLGQEYEGHAVARLILEQIAWAYAAFTSEKVEEIPKIRATKSISKLKSLDPKIGLLYGFLSDKTHIDYRNHTEFLTIKDDINYVLYTKDLMEDYALVLLYLADIYVIVWELSQHEYIEDFVAVRKVDTGYEVCRDRAFAKKSAAALNKIKEARKDGNLNDE